MKVKELIEELSKFDGDKDICLYDRLYGVVRDPMVSDSNHKEYNPKTRKHEHVDAVFLE